MASTQQRWTTLRIRAARMFRRTPWVITFLKRIYQQFRPRFTAGAVGLLFNERDEVLLVEHIFHPHHPWGPPGGWVDRNETPAFTVAREMKEEVGLQVHVEDLIDIEFLPAFRHVTFIYLCTADSYNVAALSHELIGFRWFNPDQLPNVYPYIRDGIRMALARRAHDKANSSSSDL
jgi:ADP-ribose pyrophosphatase YjhB (NUDIX family)